MSQNYLRFCRFKPFQNNRFRKLDAKLNSRSPSVIQTHYCVYYFQSDGTLVLRMATECIYCTILLLSNSKFTYGENCNLMQMTVREALNSALDEEMSADHNVFLMGEEVRSVYSLNFPNIVIYFFSSSSYITSGWGISRCLQGQACLTPSFSTLCMHAA